MTEVAALLQPDRARPPPRSTSSTRRASRPGSRRSRSACVRRSQAQGFKGEGFQLAILPGERRRLVGRARRRQCRRAQPLVPRQGGREPARRHAIASPGAGPGPAMLGWLLGQYRFDRYRKEKDGQGPARAAHRRAGADRRDGARRRSDLPGPRPGQHSGRRSRPGRAARRRSSASPTECGAKVSVTAARRSTRAIRWSPRSAAPPRPSGAPRLIELEWGDQRHPRLALVGKGVCFDSGGLDIKPSSGMRLMKKDMGGAAHALAPRPAGHEGQSAGPAPSAHPGGRECRLGRRLPPRRHLEEPQGPHRRGRQYRRGRAADPRRRAGAGGRGTSPS